MTMSQSQNRGFSLGLSDGRSLVLSNGVNLREADLPGLRSTPPGGPVAAVNTHPTDPNISGLKNLSHLPWRVRLANGNVIEVEHGKSVRLASGTRIRFGAIEGEIKDDSPAGTDQANASTAELSQIAGKRSGAWLRIVMVGAGLVVLALGGWYQLYLPAEAARRRQIAADEQRGHVETPQRQEQIQNNVEQKKQTDTQQQLEQKPAKKPEQEKAPAINDQPVAAESDNNRESGKEENAAASQGLYALQPYITFDCLDGVVIDPKTGGVSLIGHRSRPDRLLYIPYFDYLATALDYNDPAFSLEWKPNSEVAVDHALKTGGKVILDGVTRLFDTEFKLSEMGAWFLRQYGVHAVPGMSQSTALAWMLVAVGHEKTAEVVERWDARIQAEGEALGPALDALNKTLGVDGVYNELMEKFQSGAATEEQVKDIFYPKYLEALGAGLESKKNGYAAIYRKSRSQGRPVSLAFHDAQEDITPDMKALMERTLDQLSAQTPEIEIPYSIVAKAEGVTPPVVIPDFRRMPPRSLLARAFFEADYTCKQLMYAPGLKEVVPGYQTETEFFRTKGADWSSGSGYERCEIGPGEFEIIESQDGNRMRFGATPMIYTVRKNTGGGPESRKDLHDPVAEQYGALISSQYDALAQAMPTLHELRESEKILALAGWLKKRGLAPLMPKEGRGEWSPPDEIAGILHFVLSYKGGKAVVCSSADGGTNGNAAALMKIRKAMGLDDISDLKDAVAAVVTTGNGSEVTEQTLRDQLSKATTPQEKAALEVQLSHLLALKGDTLGSSAAWQRAQQDDAPAANRAEIDFQRAKSEREKAAIWRTIPKVNSGGTSTTGTAMVPLTPFEQPGLVPQADLETGIEADKKRAEDAFKYQSPPIPKFKQSQIPYAPQPSARLSAAFKDVKSDQDIQNFIKEHPEINSDPVKQKDFEDNIKKVKQNNADREKLENQINGPGTTPGDAEKIKKQIQDKDDETKKALEQLDKTVTFKPHTLDDETPVKNDATPTNP
jgi:hypothetical protein